MTTSSTALTGTDQVAQKLSNWDLTTKLLTAAAASATVAAVAFSTTSSWLTVALATVAFGTGAAAVTLRWVLNSIGGLKLVVDDADLREMVRREARREIAAAR